MSAPLRELVAAVHTPFDAHGALQLQCVEQQAEQLLADGVRVAFIGGTTGECSSLTVEERRQLATRWFDVARHSDQLRIVVHVGANCLEDARTLAEQASQLGAAAIAALSPSYFKPASVESLIACCAEITAAAPHVPFYFYDIPSLTGVHIPMPEFLLAAEKRLPSLVGLKFTNTDFVGYQLCRAVQNGKFDLLWGVDEMLLMALAAGAQGAVGSTYNFAAPLYHRLIAAFRRGDLDEARQLQLKSVQLVRVLARRGYFASAKALMSMRGVDVGAPRLPHLCLSADQTSELRQELEELAIPGILV